MVVIVPCLFFMVQMVCLWSVFVAFPGLLFVYATGKDSRESAGLGLLALVFAGWQWSKHLNLI